ncbi:MAG TPA: YggS family pyridoxal phosphate-dependent enzyme [Devosia sp.]|nr:YggS family pyridoxal phosphate-dependent enzyme [Devosia sp.]
MSDSKSGRLEYVRDRMRRAGRRFADAPGEVTLVAVSKTFPGEKIIPLLEAGQRVFGENRVQEAAGKWPDLVTRYEGVELHLVGPLQTNKVREAVALFDVIETLDREKLAGALARELARTSKNIELFVQVNIGMEEQKSGIPPDDAIAFVKRCNEVHGLDIAGLMCIPPVEAAPGPYFAQLAELAKKAGLSKLSMGMSADYETAIEMGATHVRVGSALFGART